MISAFWALVVLDAPVLALSLVAAIWTLVHLNTRYFTLTDAILLAWPIPQIAGYWIASKMKRSGDVAVASAILLVQLVVISGITVTWILLMLAHFPS